MNRLFAAFDFTDQTLDRIISVKNSIFPQNLEYKWEKKDKLHLTLKFFGDTDTKIEKSIIETISEKSTLFYDTTFSFGKFGFFYKSGIPSILWLGFNFKLTFFQNVNLLHKEFEKLGYSAENRKYVPHLTMMRLKGNENLEPLNNFIKYDFAHEEFKLKSISLYKSELKRSGSVYSKIYSIKIYSEE